MKKKRTNSTFRKLVRKAHLFLGLGSDLIIFIMAITGCLWAFQEEIEAFTSPLPEIAKQDAPVILPIKARELAHEVFPERHVHGTLYGAEDEPVKVIFYEYEPEFYHTVYLHPYSGEVLHIENNLTGFFPFVLEGHRYLWLPKPIGEQVVAWGTVIFAIMLISGIVLWWPKNRKNRKQRLTLDWKETTKWKRKNYDLHSVIGFYISIVAVVIVFTGLVMAFENFKAVAYSSLGGDKETLWRVPENFSGEKIDTGVGSMDRLYYILKDEYPQAVDLEFHYPATDEESIYVEIGYTEGIYYDADYRFYDQNTLEEITSPTIYGVYAETGFPEKVMRMNYDIHVGAIGGIPGKVLAFFASLICASLPVTGFLLWYGREFKKKPARGIRTEKERVLAVTD
ncbi:PepSY domain-containing protein [Antarcticibacterium flavum]|uniref:PepSY domain-containing protein n=1 Tax=Antarcticibacterium flavum TaxID=2058175 RepID=A0A5B7X8R0_9FLAO|nr:MULTISPECIES: PepSY-associated TM helix domain-containing protein [Antarcticibacterium]MCM4159267.1 sulfite reductase [Antarcticibacterium sp. W02-3]QCY71021.1 PepSY domain-containing protein [Antarcticibacterium flavum]